MEERDKFHTRNAVVFELHVDLILIPSLPQRLKANDSKTITYETITEALWRQRNFVQAET